MRGMRVGLAGCSLVLTMSFCGCAWLHRNCPPKYDVYPAVSIEERLTHLHDDAWNTKNPREGVWNEAYDQALKHLRFYTWQPTRNNFESELEEVEKEYPPQNLTREMIDRGKELDVILLNRTDEVLEAALGKGLDSKDSDIENLERMLKRIDREYPNLLVPQEYPSLVARLFDPWAKVKPEPYPCLDDYCLPSMVSSYSPVGVAITRMLPQPPAKQSSSGKTSDGSTPKIAFGGWIGAADTDAVSQPNSKPDDKKNPSSAADLEDFDPHQPVTLSISTVLNSPSLFDRIAYVSTYIYFRPLSGPPNGDIVLEKEFWRAFYSYYSFHRLHHATLGDDIIRSDLRQALEDISVRIEKVKTEVTPVSVALGESDAEDHRLIEPKPNWPPNRSFGASPGFDKHHPEAGSREPG